MATMDAHSYFISKKAEKEESQVQIPQLVKTSDNVTVTEVSPFNTKLKNLCKEKRKDHLDLPVKVKEEIGKYAHRYGTQAATAHFCGKYQQYTFKCTTVNNWKCKFSIPQKEVGEPPERFNNKKLPSLIGKELLVKIKEAIIGIRLRGAVISRKMVISIGNSMLKANDSSNYSEFGGGITFTDYWARRILKSMDLV